ncbi:MAG: hypothetical protein AAGI92_06380 [Pseudomonadota bacterium]
MRKSIVGLVCALSVVVLGVSATTARASDIDLRIQGDHIIIAVEPIVLGTRGSVVKLRDDDVMINGFFYPRSVRDHQPRGNRISPKAKIIEVN